MDISQARGFAVQAWCDDLNQNKIMDPDLAESFALILQRKIEESVKSSEFVAARNVCKKHLEDESLRQGYRANIAMLLADRYGIDLDHRGQAAEEILKLIFEGK